VKLSRSRCRIVGVQAGEGSFLVLGGAPHLRVKFALLTEGGETTGYFEKSSAWSDRSQELLQQLTESLESDALPRIFDEPVDETEPGAPVDEPPQI
jgi:hypothetical protein